MLAGMLGLSTVGEVEAAAAEVFPDEPISDRARAVVADALEHWDY